MKRKLESDTVSDDIKTKQSKPDVITSEQIKLLKQQLKDEGGVIGALEEFIKVLSEEVYAKFLCEYIRVTPDCNDLFSPLVADKNSARKLILLWNIVERILNILSGGNDQSEEHATSYSPTAGHTIVCNILHNHLNIIYASLSNTTKPKVRTTTLKCMASMLSQGVQTVREFMKYFEFGVCYKQFKECAKISKKQKYEEDARSCFVRFYLAFLVFGDVASIKKLLEQRDISTLLMAELHLDKLENIAIVLETIDDKIVHEFNMLKTTKLSFFSQQVLLKLVFLAKHSDENIKKLATKVIMTLCTNQKYGICFHTKDEMFTGKLVNPVLLKFLTSIKQSALAREDICELTVEILCACPDTIVPYMSGLALSLDPRLSDFWCTRIIFLVKIWEGIPKIKDICKPPFSFQLKDTIIKLLIPHVVTRQLFTNGMKNKFYKVKETTLQLLEVSLSRCMELKNLLDECKLDKGELSQWVDSIICMLPDVTPIIGIRQMAAIATEKSKQNSSLITDDDQCQSANDLEDENAARNLRDPIEMDILLDLSVKCLSLYQQLKPGILTLSGFNICKLLTFSGTVAEDVLSRSLQILLYEPLGGVSTWLKKKMSGPENVFHVLLRIMLAWKESEDIIKSSKKLFFTIMNNMGQFHNYAFEVDSWITYFLSSVDDSVIGEKVFIEEFAGACIDTVNKPFMYLENISSVFNEGNSSTCDINDFKLPSPLFFAVLRNMASETVIKSMIIPVMKELVITHDTPVLLLKVLLHEIKGECLNSYVELLGFSYHWIKGLGFDVTFMDQFAEEQLQTVPDESSSVMVRIISALLRFKLGYEDSNGFKLIGSMKESLISYCIKTTESSFNAMFTFLINVIRYVYCSIDLSSCVDIRILFDMIEMSFRVLLEQRGDLQSSKCITSNLFSLPAFSDIQDIPKVWRDFSLSISLLILEFCSGFKAMHSFKCYIDKLINTIIVKHNDIACESVDIFCKLARHLDDKMLFDYIEDIVVSIFTFEEELTDGHLAMFLKLFDTLKQIGLKDLVTSKLQSQDVNIFLHKCITSHSVQMMRLFCDVISILRFGGDICINQKDYNELLYLDQVFIGYSIFLCKMNILIAKSDELSNSETVYFNDELVDNIMKDKIKSADLITNLLPLLIGLIKIDSSNIELHSKLNSLLWEEMMERLGSPNIVKLLILLLPCTTDDEKLECLNKVIVVFRNKCDLEEKESQFDLCKKIFLSLTSGKKQKICLLELITVVMEMITDMKLDDTFFNPCINYLLCLVQMMPKFESKLKSERYVNLSALWMKFVKKILKGRYNDTRSMSVLLDCIDILYTNKQFSKVCTLQVKDLYQFVVSHSKFLEIMFAEDEAVAVQKCVMIKIISSLIKLSNVHMPALVPMLLVAYETKLTEKDQYVLSVLRTFEKNGVSLSQFYPFVWGSQAFDVYKEKESKSSLYREQSSAQVLENIDKEKMLKSAIDFPIYLKFDDFVDMMYTENYDPAFYLPSFLTLMQPERVVDCHHFMESGCLSFVLAAISSFDMNVRELAYSVLSLYNDHLESARFREKRQITYLLMLLKHSMVEEFMRFPSVWVSYFIQYIRFVLKPDHHLYTVLNNVILQKPIINVKELPVFLNLFSSHGVEHSTERGWILKLLVDGLKDLTDYYLYRKYHVFEILIAFYDTQICDQNMKMLIHDILRAACSFKTAAFDLIKTNSVVSWIHMNIMVDSKGYKSSFINLLFTIANSFQESYDKNEDGKSINTIPKLLLHETTLLCENVLQMNSLDYKECLQICFVNSWIRSVANQFGDIHMWQLGINEKHFFDIVTDLLFQAQTDTDKVKISEIFCDIVLTQLGNDETALEDKPWRKIYCIAKDRKMNNIVKLFNNMTKHCHVSKNKTLLLKILNAVEC